MIQLRLYEEMCLIGMLTHACIPGTCARVSHFFWISANCTFHFCSSDHFKAKTDTESLSAESDGEKRGCGEETEMERVEEKKKKSRDKKQERQLLFSLSFHPVIG